MSKLTQLKEAFEAATPDWVVVPADDEGNTEGKYIEIHDGYGRTATVAGGAGGLMRQRRIIKWQH